MKEYFYEGGLVMWPLLILSFIATVFIVERAIFFAILAAKRKPWQVQKVLSLVEKGQFEEAQQLAERHKADFVINSLLNGLNHREQSLTRSLETQAFNELRRMKKHLTVLDTVITAAPLLGILGTVFGIIASFKALGVQGIGDPLAVTQGISEALVTTAFGLVIALITLIPFNIFQSRCQRAREELESVGSLLEILLQKESSK